jgi:hypothetical protein
MFFAVRTSGTLGAEDGLIKCGLQEHLVRTSAFSLIRANIPDKNIPFFFSIVY